jgi:excisionase family DNA binding protein
MARRPATRSPHPIAPTEAERHLAREASRRLSVLATRSARLELRQPDRPGEAVEIPAAALPLFRKVLDQIAEGRPVAIVADDAELSTQQAAELLGVSRPFLIGLLERGAIPFRRVGAHRSVRLHDLMDYKRRDDADRFKAMEALAAQAQELGMGY